MKTTAAKHSTKADGVQMFLFALLTLSAFADVLRRASAGGISGMGLLTILGCGAAWAMWLSRPFLPNDLLKPLLPLMMFEFYGVGSLLWYFSGTAGLQLLCVGLGFLAIILLVARETNGKTALGLKFHTVILYTSAIPVCIYFLQYLKGVGADEGALGARSFALYVMVPMAIALARWRAGNILCLIWGLIIVVVVMLSMSRTSMVVLLLLIPASVALRGNKKSLTLALLILISASFAFGTAVMVYQPLHDRFFKFDASMKVGGVAVNASGRTKMWNALLDSLGNDWMFGKGIASSEHLITIVMPQLGQPHNDFLRFYYDLGMIGLGMWLAFVITVIWAMAGNLRRSIANRTPDYPLHVAGILAITALSGSMGTDNSISYCYVMMPLAVVIGSSLGAGRCPISSLGRSTVGVQYALNHG